MRYLIILFFLPLTVLAETTIKRIDEDTIKITETKTIKLSDLEEKLEERKAINKIIEQDEVWLENLDKDKKSKFIRMPKQETKELEKEIDEYKKMPIIGISELPVSR